MPTDLAVLAEQISTRLEANISFWVVVVGFVGVFIGAVIQVVGSFGLQWIQDRPRRNLDSSRKKMLLQMLKDTRFPERWRKIGTLSRVIGADDETTKRLLFEVGARGSERDDGLWGLIEHHPFDKTDQ